MVDSKEILNKIKRENSYIEKNSLLMGYILCG